jgi:DNA (cytosine-5)-methyltransferase 1
MEFIDWFAGIGGFRLGLEKAGHQCLGYVEWDKFARKSYEAMHNTEGEWTAHDIRDVRAGDIPKADIWTSGFPCTDISRAKSKREGLEGESSGLFLTLIHLLEKMEEERKPSYFFNENVADLLSVNGGWDFARLLLELDRVGYDAEWQVINSDGYLPQNRDRVFVVGRLRGRRTRKVFPITRKSNKARLKQVATFDIKGQDAIKRIYDPRGLCPTLTTMQGGHRQPKILLPDGRARKLTPRECWRVQGFPDALFDRAVEVNSDSQLYKQAGNSVSVPVIYQIAKEFHIDE